MVAKSFDTKSLACNNYGFDLIWLCPLPLLGVEIIPSQDSDSMLNFVCATDLFCEYAALP